MLISTLILGFIFQVAAQAQSKTPTIPPPAEQPCQDRMTQLRGDRFGFQQIGKPTYNAAAKALNHYRELVKTEPTISQYVAYYRVATGTVTGYRFTVNARDERFKTEMTYYFDVSKKLVYAKKAPAPTSTYWFCEQ